MPECPSCGQAGDGEGRFAIPDPQTFPIWLNLVLFAASGVVIWVAGTRLAWYAESIADRTGLGQAVVGVLILAVATSLPEIASVATTAFAGNAPLAVNNLLGGIVVQTSILAIADRVGGRKALTHFVARPVLLLEGLLVVVLLTITLTGIGIGDMVTPLGIGLWPVAIVAVYLFGLTMVKRYQQHDVSWEPAGEGSDEVKRVQAEEDAKPAEGFEGWSNPRLYLAFAGGSAVILVAGTAVGRTGDALASQSGLGEGFIGLTLLALATSLPDLSTTISAARIGAHSLAVSNIFGSTMLLPALLLVADVVYREGPVVGEVGRPAIFAAGAGTVVTAIYLLGLVERRDRTIWGFGVDSFAVLGVFAVSIVAQYLLQ